MYTFVCIYSLPSHSDIKKKKKEEIENVLWTLIYLEH